MISTTPTTRTAAQRIVDQIDDIDSAVSMLKDELRRSGEYELIIDQAYRLYCQQAIYSARASSVRLTKAKATLRDADVMRMTSIVHTRGLMNMLMPDGRTLADYTGIELVKQASEERRRAAGHAKRASFFESIAKFAESETVKARLSESKLEELWKES